MRARHRQPERTATRARKKPAAVGSPPPEAYEHYDEVSTEVVKSIQRRADKVLKKGKWVVVDGYVDKR